MLLLLIAALTSGAAFIAWWISPPSFQQHQIWLESVARGVESGQIVPQSGIIKFKADVPRGVAGRPLNMAYVDGTSATGWTIFIPWVQGKASNIRGFLYRSAPLPRSPGTFISLPVYWGPGGPPGSATPTSSSLEIERTLNARWSIAGWHAD